MVCHSGLATESGFLCCCRRVTVAMVFLCARETTVHLVSFWNSHPEPSSRVVGRLFADRLEEVAKYGRGPFRAPISCMKAAEGKREMPLNQKGYLEA